jgi:hypothetical protein
MIRLVSAALLALAPVGASAQLRPSAPEAVAEAVADCWAAVGAKEVDRAALTRAGWAAGSITDPKGGSVGTPLQLYGKAGSNVVLMLMRTAKTPACTVMSRVGSTADVSLVAQAVQRRLTAAEPQVKTTRSDGSIVFIALPKIAMLDATGTKAQPAVRISVGYQGAERG